VYEEQERMRDLPGTEEDNDMRDEELEELFGPEARAGGGAEDPVNLADGEDEEQGGENNAGEVSRPSTSDVWLDFKKLFKPGPKGKQIRYVAVCIHCNT